jgi:hypothetical protein
MSGVGKVKSRIWGEQNALEEVEVEGEVTHIMQTGERLVPGTPRPDQTRPHRTIFQRKYNNVKTRTYSSWNTKTTPDRATPDYFSTEVQQASKIFITKRRKKNF